MQKHGRIRTNRSLAIQRRGPIKATPYPFQRKSLPRVMDHKVCILRIFFIKSVYLQQMLAMNAEWRAIATVLRRPEKKPANSKDAAQKAYAIQDPVDDSFIDTHKCRDHERARPAAEQTAAQEVSVEDEGMMQYNHHLAPGKSKGVVEFVFSISAYPINLLEGKCGWRVNRR